MPEVQDHYNALDDPTKDPAAFRAALRYLRDMSFVLSDLSDHAIYYNYLSLNGLAGEPLSDGEGGDWLTCFDVEDQDRVLFPDLEGKKHVYLRGTSDGFIYELDEVDGQSWMESEEEMYEHG